MQSLYENEPKSQKSQRKKNNSALVAELPAQQPLDKVLPFGKHDSLESITSRLSRATIGDDLEFIIQDKDGLFSLLNAKELLLFIQKNPITSSILLPIRAELLPIQRAIDTIVFTNQREKNKQIATSLVATMPSAITLPTQPGKRPDKKRTVTTQISHQKQQQIQVSISFAAQHQLQQKQDINPVIGLDFERFYNALLLNELQLNPGINLLTKETLKKQWHTWLGDVLTERQNKVGIDLLKQEGIPESTDAPITIKIFLIENESQLPNNIPLNTVYVQRDTTSWTRTCSFIWSDGINTHKVEKTINQVDSVCQKFDPQEICEINKTDNKAFFEEVESIYIYNTKQSIYSNNKLLHSISKPALEQLLNHNQQFKNGLSLSQLPKGFHILPGEKDTFILHYDLEANPKQALLAPCLVEPLAHTPMASCVVEEIMELLPNTHWLKIRYTKRQDIDYLFFRNLAKYLPVVLGLTEIQAQVLMKFCCDTNNTLNAASLNYVLEHRKKITAIFQKETNLQDKLVCKALRDAFPGKSMQELIVLIDTLSTPNEQGDKHILHALLITNNALDIRVKNWLFTEICTNQITKDACLEVYAHAGVEGLQTLHALWTTYPECAVVCNQLITLNDSLSFLPFIKDPIRFINALNSIQGFKLDKPTYTWWSTLLKKHTQAVGYDDLYTLVESFVAFKKIIEEDYSLSFYEGIVFDDVKSMPTALSNMLILLRECKQRDRQCQWDCISTLSLHSNGAVRASIDKECGFVTPQMHVMPEEFDIRFGYATPSDASEINPYNDEMNVGFDVEVIDKTIEELQQSQKQYYRYLAHTHQRLPLSFYQEIDLKIVNSGVDALEKISLLSIVAISTSGENAEECANPEKMASIVDDILQKLQNNSISSTVYAMAKMAGLTSEQLDTAWKRELIRDLGKYALNIPLTLRHRLLNMQITWMASLTDLVAFMADFNGLQQATTILTNINSSMNNAGSKSMRFYPENIHSEGKESLLVNHIFTSLTLLGGQRIFTDVQSQDSYHTVHSFFQVTDQSLYLSDKKNAALVSIISHFGLARLTKEENIKIADEIYQLFDKAKSCHRWDNGDSIVAALQHLYSMDKQPSPPLTANDLKQFIQHFIDNRIRNEDVVSVVKTWYGDYFPEGYFEALETQKIPEGALKVVQKTFKDEETDSIKKILSQLIPYSPSIEEYTRLIQKIAVLHNVEGLAKTTRQTFLAHLSSTALLKDATFNDFDKLLSAIGQYKSLQPFLFFAEKAAQYPKTRHKDLIKKATFYLKEGFPVIPPFESLSRIEVQDSALHMILHANASDLSMKNFENITHPIDDLCVKYASVKESMLPFLMHFLMHNYSSSLRQTDFSINAIKTLGEAFNLIEDPHLLLSLCANTHTKNTYMTPSSLLHFLQSQAYLDCPDKHALFTCLAALLNNKVDVELDQIKTLINHPKAMDALSYYKTAPYPSVESVLQWLDEDTLQTQYALFEKNPYPRDEKNTFDKLKALEHAGFQVPNGLVTQEIKKIIDTMGNAIFDAQQLSMAEIKELLSKKGLSPIQLLALTTELLTRTTGSELNTTQYLATYTLLKSGNRSISAEIATGEGKSRITMLLAALDFLRGQTVDVITKDMALAERDYLSYHAFFKALGAPTGLIYSADTQTAAYKIKGINFSICSELANFRGEAITQGMGKLVIDPIESQRTLLIDEVDHTLFALSDTEYNVARSNNTLKGNAWIYENMVDFFYKYPLAKDWDNATCNPFFRSFIQSIRPDKSAPLADISNKQLDSWLESALTAFELKFNAKPGFVIASGIEKETANGLQVFSEAHVYDDCRADAHSTFTAGVHQFLHARLNWLKQHLPDSQSLSVDDKQLVDYFKTTQANPFQIKEEEIISFSSTSYDLVKDYEKGKCYGLTGTFTTQLLKEEAQTLYGMEVVAVPRHNALQRVDHPVYLVSETKKEQLALIREQIIEAKKNGQPILLINKNDAATEALRSALEDLEDVRFFTAHTAEDEAHYIKNNAGLPSQTTVSTGMHGRGTDIGLSEEAKQKGLHVMVSFMPESEEEMIQIFGRAGRQGQKGEAQLILNKQDLKKQLGKTSLDDGFYTATETYLTREQTIFSRKKQIERLIKYSVKNFQYDLQKDYYRCAQKSEMATQQWSSLLDASNKIWQTHWESIQAKMGSLELSDETIISINQCINAYKEQFSGLYKDYLNKDMPESSWDIPNKITTLLKTCDLPPLKTTVAEAYHPAHDGKAILYTKPFEKLRAVFRGERPVFADFRAWWNGRGILCPNLRAWWHGHMTADQFLYGCSDMSGIYQKLLITGTHGIGFLTGAGIGAVLLQFTNLLPLLGLTTALAAAMGPIAAPIVSIVLIILIAGIVGLAAVGITYGLYKFYEYCTAPNEPVIVEPEANREGPEKESYSLFGKTLGLKAHPVEEVKSLVGDMRIVEEKTVSHEPEEIVTRKRSNSI